LNVSFDVNPWVWQDTATLICVVSLLLFAFLLARRIRARPAAGCHGCASLTPTAPAPGAGKVVIPMSGLRLGTRKSAQLEGGGAAGPAREQRLKPQRSEDHSPPKEGHG